MGHQSTSFKAYFCSHLAPLGDVKLNLYECTEKCQTLHRQYELKECINLMTIQLECFTQTLLSDYDAEKDAWCNL